MRRFPLQVMSVGDAWLSTEHDKSHAEAPLTVDGPTELVLREHNHTGMRDDLGLLATQFNLVAPLATCSSPSFEK